MEKYWTPWRTAFAEHSDQRPTALGTALGINRVMLALAALILAAALAACRQSIQKQPSPKVANIEPFTFQISSGNDQYQIEGFLAHADRPGRLPALLVLNGYTRAMPASA